MTDALCCNKKEEEPKETKEKESPYDFSNGGLKLKEGWEIVDGQPRKKNPESEIEMEKKGGEEG